MLFPRKLLLTALALPLLGLAGRGAKAEEAPGPVQIRPGEHKLEITIQGRLFAVYRTDPKLPKPFMHPVFAAPGVSVVRPLENPEDHPHHKGIWVAVDEVNEVDFWAERGHIVNRRAQVLCCGQLGKLAVENHWETFGGKLIVVEKTTITIHPNGLMEYDIHFVAPKTHPVVFEDTKEGLFGIRIPNWMRERQGGKVVNSDGLKGTAACWGRRAAWVDYYNTYPKDKKIYGVALMDHPENPYPARYHVRNYGLFTLNPFGERAYTRGKLPPRPVKLQPGQSLRLRYAIYIHPGDTQQAKVDAVYRRWIGKVASQSQ